MGVRVDVWLWSVRIFRTRTAANAACTSGGVRINDVIVKPSRAVAVGDHITARAAGRLRIVEVVETPKKRVGASVAAESFIDNSPPPEPRKGRLAPPAAREKGSGRPTKRDRRKIDEFRGTDHFET
jgi:ribosome-associated heat shock protein Hsp15